MLIIKILLELDYPVKITSYLCFPALEIDTQLLKITFTHQNSSRNGLFVKITLKRRTTLFAIYVKNRTFYPGIDF